MKNLVLILILAVVSSSAMAEWIPVVTNDTGTITYVDPATARKASNKVKIWELVDYKTVQEDADGRYMSAMVRTQYDCKEEQTRILYGGFLSENMGRGDVVSTHNEAVKWEPVEPESIGMVLFEFACGK